MSAWRTRCRRPKSQPAAPFRPYDRSTHGCLSYPDPTPNGRTEAERGKLSDPVPLYDEQDDSDDRACHCGLQVSFITRANVNVMPATLLMGASPARRQLAGGRYGRVRHTDQDRRLKLARLPEFAKPENALVRRA